jgi:uncharacterized protein YjiS (DUF1127 family)
MDAVKRWGKSIFDRIAAAQQRRVHYWQLMNLTNKELNDIGINRSDIQRAIYGKL